MASFVITEMIHFALDRVGPPSIGVFRAVHDSGLLRQLRSAGIWNRHRVFAFLRDRTEFRSLRIDDRRHGIAGFHLDRPVFDASVKSPAFPHRVRINSVWSADAVRNRTAVWPPDVVRGGSAVIAGGFSLESALAADDVVVATFF